MDFNHDQFMELTRAIVHEIDAEHAAYEFVHTIQKKFNIPREFWANLINSACEPSQSEIEEHQKLHKQLREENEGVAQHGTHITEINMGEELEVQVRSYKD